MIITNYLNEKASRIYILEAFYVYEIKKSM